MTENFADALRRISCTMPALPESAGLARRVAEVVLREWTSPVDEFTAELLLSEAFTNALLHAVDPSAEVAVSIAIIFVETETGLHVEVHDPDEGESGDVLLKRSTTQSESGRGLELIEALSARWGVVRTAAGKFVFFDLDDDIGRSPGRSAIGRQRREPACSPSS